MNALAARVSFALCFAIGAVAQEPDTEAILKKARELLTAHGCAVPDTVRAEERTAAEVIADLDAHQDLFLPADTYYVLHAVRKSLGLPTGRDAAALRRQGVAGAARGLSAYYDPLRKVFVLLNTATRDTAEALGGTVLPLVAHELVHAVQDAREGGLAGFFGGDARTIDSTHARRCVIEGEAELVSITAIRGVAAMRQAIKGRTAQQIEKLFTGEMTGTIYDAGRRLALRQYDASGDAAFLALWKAPPPSTEQVLHPGKLGRDTPTPVAVPEVEGLTQAHKSTLGELVLYDLLRQCGTDEKTARLAAAGWDGDQLAVLQGDDGKVEATVWRSVWDRDGDAEEFGDALAARKRGVVVCDGRVVDWIRAGDDAIRERIAAACAKSRPQPPRDEGDEASTAAAEVELLADLPQDTAADGFWRHTNIGLAIPFVEGWEVRDLNGVRLMIEKESAASGFAVNINVQVVPRGAIETTQQLLDANRDQVAAMKGLEVDSFEIGTRGEQEVVEGEYHGRIGRMQSMHFLALLYVRGDDQVVVTATSLEKDWKDHEAKLRKILAGIRISPP